MQLFTYVIFASALISLSYQQSCDCTLDASPNYPGTTRWDCTSRNLTVVPGQCWNLASDNVTEVILTDNRIDRIAGTDFVGMTAMKAVYINRNVINSFDGTVFLGIDLDIIDLSNNINMDAPLIVPRLQTNLQEYYIFGSSASNFPDVTDSTKLRWLDIRSCEIVAVPRPIFNAALVPTGDFVLNMVGNSFVDIAVDSLIVLPPDTTIMNFEAEVRIWYQDEAERSAFVNQNYIISFTDEGALTDKMRQCGVDTPTDATQC